MKQNGKPVFLRSKGKDKGGELRWAGHFVQFPVQVRHLSDHKECEARRLRPGLHRSFCCLLALWDQNESSAQLTEEDRPKD